MEPEYPLGHAESEPQRLAFQARYWSETTRERLGVVSPSEDDIDRLAARLSDALMAQEAQRAKSQ